jgi:phage gp46-like protein
MSQEGDILLISNLSLQGGNIDDNGTESTKNKGWWGNQLEDEPSKKLVSRLQNIIRGIPATPANLRKAIQAASDDLAWFISEGIADSVPIQGSLVGRNRLQLIIEILKDGNKIAEFKWLQNWLAEMPSNEVQ